MHKATHAEHCSHPGQNTTPAAEMALERIDALVGSCPLGILGQKLFRHVIYPSQWSTI